MTEPPSSTPSTIPSEISAELRTMMHDLSNALEIILQSGYLLSMAGLEDPSKEWVSLLDRGAQQALEIHRKLRDYIRSHS